MLVRGVVGGLVGGLGLPLVAGCRRLPVLGGPAAPDPDAALTDDAASRERVLLATYDAAAAAAPALAARLAPLRAEHVAHLAALGRSQVPAASASPSVTPSTTPSPVPTPPPVPADAAGALAVLRELEAATATRHGDVAVRCGRGLAVVLASLAASEASHVGALA